MTSTAMIDLEGEILKDLIIRGWRYLFHFQACLLEEKQQLDGFLSEYYAQLGGWLQQAAQAAGTGEGGETTKLVNHLHAQHKMLYRDLLKLCHPDVLAHPQAAQWLRQTCQAYGEGNGYQLVALRLFIWQETLGSAQYLQALRLEYGQLQSQVTETREAIQALRQSPAYRLQQRILHARRRGHDLLGYITGHLRASVTMA